MTNGLISLPLDLQSQPGALSFGSVLADRHAGWTHVAVTYDGSDTSCALWIDGVVVDSFTGNLATTIPDDAGITAWYAVGPGAPGDGVAVDLDDVTWVVDEVAISSVARTEDEVRREAYVAPIDRFTDVPAGVQIPIGLEEAATFWPVGLPHTALIEDLGRDLFHSNVLSHGNDRSCSTCHEANHGFAEELALGESLVPGESLDFNTPTLLGSLFTGPKTFSGRARTTLEQVLMPLTNAAEMGNPDIDSVIDRLSSSGFWQARFQAAMGANATSGSLASALSAYVLTLNTGNAPLDQEALTPTLTDQQRLGRGIFHGKARCIGCHSGPAFTDGDFHNIQSVRRSILDRGAFTGRVREDGALKTPTLRNLGSTGPYFHDGSKVDLAAVVEHYDRGFSMGPATPGLIGGGPIPNPIVGEPDRFFRPLGLAADEKAALVAFLESLNGSTP